MGSKVCRYRLVLDMRFVIIKDGTLYVIVHNGEYYTPVHGEETLSIEIINDTNPYKENNTMED